MQALCICIPSVSICIPCYIIINDSLDYPFLPFFSFLDEISKRTFRSMFFVFVFIFLLTRDSRTLLLLSSSGLMQDLVFGSLSTWRGQSCSESRDRVQSTQLECRLLYQTRHNRGMDPLHFPRNSVFSGW